MAWLDDLQIYGKNRIKLMLLGNKLDLEHERVVNKDMALDLAEKYDFFFMEVSAKTNEDNNVGKAFESLLKEILLM